MTHPCPIAILCEMLTDRGIAYTGDLRIAGRGNTINGHPINIGLWTCPGVSKITLMFPPDYASSWSSNHLTADSTEADAEAVARSTLDTLEHMQVIRLNPGLK
jgi:hypothetical protein